MLSVSIGRGMLIVQGCTQALQLSFSFQSNEKRGKTSVFVFFFYYDAFPILSCAQCHQALYHGSGTSYPYFSQEQEAHWQTGLLYLHPQRLNLLLPVLFLDYGQSCEYCYVPCFSWATLKKRFLFILPVKPSPKSLCVFLHSCQLKVDPWGHVF